MLVPIFSLKLNNKICARTVAIGKYDGIHPCLTAATLAGKVFIHNPHQKYSFQGGRTDASSSSSSSTPLIDTNLSLLNINAGVTSISTGCLDLTNKNELLLVGTKTSLLAYDVNNNSDLFYKELPDGANACVVGMLGNYSDPVAVVGGNCSIMALDKQGEEVMWTVTGDNIASLELLDFNGDSKQELICGSEDFDIRIFRQDEIICEMSETESIIALKSLTHGRFGYALANGSVGVYEKNIRAWRIKSRNMAMAFD
jgi:Bardet-Biedl syndrome 2 protein